MNQDFKIMISGGIIKNIMKLKKPSDNEQCQLCGRWKNRPVGVDVVIVNDGKILLIKRSTDPDKGKYALPGGYLDYNETLEEGAIREVKEETGLNIKIVKTLNILSHPDRYRQIVEVSFIASIIGGEEVAGEDVDKTIWVNPNSLPENMATIGEHDKIIKNALPFLS